MVNEQLKNHLKNFTVKELKKEVIAVKKGFQVSKLRRADVENVILKNHQHFLHLLKKKKVKKAKPLTKVKKAKPMSKQENAKPKKSQYEAFIRVKEYITGLLDELDEKVQKEQEIPYSLMNDSVVSLYKKLNHSTSSAIVMISAI